MKEQVIRYLKNYWLVLAAALMILITIVVLDHRGFKPQQGVQLATVSPKVIKLEEKTIVPKQVVVLEEKAKSNLGLPPQVRVDKKKHVIAATQVERSLKPQTITTVLDEETGVSQTYTTVEKYPWLGANPSGSLSLSYGLRSGEPVTRLSMTQDVFQIKAINFGGVGHLDSDGQYFVGVGATYRWYLLWASWSKQSKPR